MEGMLKILTGGGVNSSGNSDGRGSLNVKIHARGLLSILLMFQLLQLIKKKLLCIVQFYYSFKLQTSYHIYFKFPSIGSPLLLLSVFVEATCDNLKISRKITFIIHKKALNSSKANNDFYLELNIFPRSMLFQGDLPLNTPCKYVSMVVCDCSVAILKGKWCG